MPQQQKRAVVAAKDIHNLIAPPFIFSGTHTQSKYLYLFVKPNLMKNFLIILTLLFSGVATKAQIINTVAGNGTVGYSGDGGIATTAQLNIIADVAVTPDGGFLITDILNMRLRKVNAGGIITTIAGNGTATITGDGGPATLAGIGNAFRYVCTDATGNIYISQPGRIRRIDPSGIITTIAGTGTSGYSTDGFPATSVQIGNISSLATDASGAVYFVENEYFRVRKISGGILTTVAGNGTGANTGDGGPATSASLRPLGVAIDGTGNIYISVVGLIATSYSYIRKVNTAGIINTIAGTGTTGYSGDGGPALSADISFAGGLCTEAAGNIYFADNTHHVRKINTTGIISTIAGTGIAGFAGDGCRPEAALLYNPVEVAIDTNNVIYIVDQSNYRIRSISAGNTPVFTGGSFQFMGACKGVATGIDTLLSVSDADAGQTINWAGLLLPAHGSLFATYSGSVTTPAGLYYSAAAGYTGADTFSVVATDCAGAADTTTLYVTVTDTLIAPTITGADTVCEGNTTTLTGSAAGGYWNSSNSALATISSSGVVTGIAAGAVVMTYTRANSCGAASGTHSMSVRSAAGCAAGIDELPEYAAVKIWPNPTTNGILHLLIAGNASSPAQITITGTDGKTVYRSHCETGKEIMVQLAAGIYVVQTTTSVSATHTIVTVE